MPNGNADNGGCTTACWGDLQGSERCGGDSAASVWALAATEVLLCVDGPSWGSPAGSLVCGKSCWGVGGWGLPPARQASALAAAAPLPTKSWCMIMIWLVRAHHPQACARFDLLLTRAFRRTGLHIGRATAGPKYGLRAHRSQDRNRECTTAQRHLQHRCMRMSKGRGMLFMALFLHHPSVQNPAGPSVVEVILPSFLEPLTCRLCAHRAMWLSRR